MTEMTEERLAETGTAIYNLLLAARVDPTLRKWAQTANDGFEFLRAELVTTKAENERLRMTPNELLDELENYELSLRLAKSERYRYRAVLERIIGNGRCDQDVWEMAHAALNPEPAP